jgi:hypothetical protein
MRTRGYTSWCGIPSFTTSLTQNVGDGPGLTTDSVVFCNLMHNKTICANSEGSNFMLSSSNNIVSNLYPQGVTQVSRRRERSHVESLYPQGAAPTLDRERSQSHAESTHPQGVARTYLGRRDHSHTWRVYIHKVWRRHPWKGRDHSHAWRVYIHKVRRRHPYKGRAQRRTWRVRSGRRQGRRRRSFLNRGSVRRRPAGEHTLFLQR